MSVSAPYDANDWKKLVEEANKQIKALRSGQASEEAMQKARELLSSLGLTDAQVDEVIREAQGLEAVLVPPLMMRMRFIKGAMFALKKAFWATMSEVNPVNKDEAKESWRTLAGKMIEVANKKAVDWNVEYDNVLARLQLCAVKSLTPGGTRFYPAMIFYELYKISEKEAEKVSLK